MKIFFHRGGAAFLATFLLVFACGKPYLGDVAPDDDRSGTDTTVVAPPDSAPEVPPDTSGVNPAPMVFPDILDIRFNPDGSAWNAAEGGRVVQTVPGSSMCTYYNEDFHTYAAHFNLYPAGGALSSGYFKFDYSLDDTVKDKLSDGHSLEMVLRLDCTPDGSSEIKAMCAHQSGGTGIMVSASDRGTALTFLPNVSTTGVSTWRWATSGIKPVKGRYYHVVGVWDKEAAKASVYVNGELCGTVDAPGNFKPAVNGATWFCIGGDSQSAANAESGWYGDIVTARIYGDVLSSAQVATLWEMNGMRTEDNFVLSDICFQPVMNVVPGCRINVYAEGLEGGDFIELADNEGTGMALDCSVAPDHISGRIPGNFKEGEYTVAVSRGNMIYPIGRASFRLAGITDRKPEVKCVAHRGYHPDAQHPENSIAALRYAQQLGVYGSEFDVWQTTDGGLFVNHDGTLGGVKIASSTTAVVEKLTLGNGERIPTLRQYLEEGAALPSVKLILELKHYEATDASVALVKEMKMDGQVEWIAFDYDACKRVRELLPDAPVQYLGGDRSPAEVASDGLSAIDYSYSVLNMHPEWIDEAHAKGLAVNVWTVNSDFENWVEKGVDLITTDRAETLQKVLNRVFVEP